MAMRVLCGDQILVTSVKYLYAIVKLNVFFFFEIYQVSYKSHKDGKLLLNWRKSYTILFVYYIDNKTDNITNALINGKYVITSPLK